MSSTPSYPVFTLFDSFYKTIFGVSANDFVYKQGETFLSNPEQVLTLCVGYLIVIFGGQKLMKNYKPIQLTFLFQIHNVFLTFISGLLLALFVEELYYINRDVGALKTLCSAQAYTSRMDLFYYLNYLTKYYEFVDTFFLVMKKKDLQFLHWYHHSMTAALCYINITSRTTATWVVVTLNLFVHVFMYYYYFLTTLNVRVWWKKYITVMQISQFIIDLVVVFSGTYTFFAFNFYPSLPNFGDCSTTRFSSIFSCSLLTSYLVLFIQFFFKSYSKKTTTPKEKKLN